MSAIDDVVQQGLTELRVRAERKETESARAAFDAISEHREAWQAIINQIEAALPDELHDNTSHDGSKAPRSLAAFGEIHLLPVVLNLPRCTPILAYSNGGPVRYKVQAPAVEWNEDAQQLEVVYPGCQTTVREHEYSDGIKDETSDWTDSVAIAVKRANELVTIVNGLHYEVLRRNHAGERPPARTAAQMFLENAERRAQLSGDKALVYVLLAIAHKMID